MSRPKSTKVAWKYLYLVVDEYSGGDTMAYSLYIRRTGDLDLPISTIIKNRAKELGLQAKWEEDTMIITLTV